MTKYYYRLTEDNKIIDYTSFEENVDLPSFIKELYTETDREIIVLTDGSFAFKDEVDLDEEARKKAEKKFNEAKNAKITELKQMRDTLEVEPIEYNGNLFDYDDKSRERIRTKRQEIEDNGGTGTIEWTLADNTEVVIGLVDFIGINNEATKRAGLLHIHYRTKRELVDNATTIAEVEAIEW